VRPLGQLR